MALICGIAITIHFSDGGFPAAFPLSNSGLAEVNQPVGVQLLLPPCENPEKNLLTFYDFPRK
jgi:hypothetical protein